MKFSKIILSFLAFFAVLEFIPNAKVHAQKTKFTPKPATMDDINTYSLMSTATFCRSRDLGIDYQKSLTIALTGQASVFFSKHGALLTGVKTKLTEQQFTDRAGFLLLNQALNVCPKSVPAAEKTRIKEAIERAKKLQKK